MTAGGDVPGGAALAVAMGENVQLRALVRWLSLPYGNSEPVFAGADGLGTVDGQPMPEAAALRTLYRDVCGPGVPAAPGAQWRRCECCGVWTMSAPEKPLTALAHELRWGSQG